MSVTEGFFVVFFALFLLLMRSNFRRTFFSRMTGKAFNNRIFLEGKTDEARIMVFTDHRSYWEPIREELTTWVGDMWHQWNDPDSKPEWFTNEVKATVPLEMIPN